MLSKANSYFSIASEKTDSSRDTAKNNKFLTAILAQLLYHAKIWRKKERCRNKKTDREFLTRV